jgi:hypothetical protein
MPLDCVATAVVCCLRLVLKERLRAERREQRIKKIPRPEAVGRGQRFVVMRCKGLVVEVEKFEDVNQ